jgi:hypothetical protein
MTKLRSLGIFQSIIVFFMIIFIVGCYSKIDAREGSSEGKKAVTKSSPFSGGPPSSFMDATLYCKDEWGGGDDHLSGYSSVHMTVRQLTDGFKEKRGWKEIEKDQWRFTGNVVDKMTDKKQAFQILFVKIPKGVEVKRMVVDDVEASSEDIFMWLVEQKKAFSKSQNK